MDIKIDSYTGGLASTNAWLLAIKNKNLLFDAPEGTLDWLIERNYQVDALFLTHQHWDHVQDVGGIIEKYNCPLYSWSPFGGEELTLARRFQDNYGIPCEVAPYIVDKVLVGKEVTEFGDVKFDLKHVPGHSPDSVCYHVENFLICGDTVMDGSIGRTDLPHSDDGVFIPSILTALNDLDAKVNLLPGHGSQSVLAKELKGNPFLQN